MFNRSNRYLRILAVPAVLLLAPGLSHAQVDTSAWLCESCPFESGYRADYEAGATYVSDDAARFGNGTGLDEEGTYADLNGTGRYINDGYQLDWYLGDLGLDSRVVDIRGGRQGSYEFNLGYREQPYRRFDTTQTIFSRSSSDTLSRPPGWVPASTTSAMTGLSSALQFQDIGSDRQIMDIGAGWTPTNSIKLFADYRHEKRDGVDIMAGPSFTQSSLLPRWFDFETDQVDIGIQYATRRGSLKLAYYGSFFSNQSNSLTWDTPYTSSPGAEQLRLAQEPDNDFQQLSLSGIWRATVWDTALAFSAAVGRGEQDDKLLPYTINPDVNAGVLPVTSLNAEVDTGNYAFTVTSRPTDRTRLKLAYSFDERDNSTAQSDWVRVIVDLFDSGDIEQNIPYSFERSRLKLSGEVRIFNDIRLSGGYERTELDRDYQEVAEQTEDLGWGQIRWRPVAWFDLRARGGSSERDIDRYDTTVATSLGQNPLLRKYYLAYRYREFGELTASASMPEKPFSVSATVFVANDSYTQSQLGMTDSDELRYTADFSWSVTENASTYLMIGRETIDAEQLGSELGGTSDWEAQHDDSFDHVGFGFMWRQPEGKLDLKLDYTRGEGETNILVSSIVGGQSQLPDLTSTLDSLRLEAVYRWSDRWETTVDLRYEQFSVDDWTLQDVEPDTLPTILTLGADPYDYDVWAIGMGFRYNFGSRDIALVN
jgi:MtrB/PioB family decaheme-associated outer membrane protein